MTKISIQDLLRKINYIEADIEIQKQILFSIPSDQQGDLEKTVRLIAAKKNEIASLRRQVQELDPEEYQRIVVFEQALEEFRKVAAVKTFRSISNRNVGEQCVLALAGGGEVECLIKACTDEGDWTVITLEGEVQHFGKKEVAEKAPQNDNSVPFN